MLKRFLAWCATPSELVGPADNPLIRRWFLFPKNPWFGIYLHHIRRSDDDRALHDHPKPNISILLSGAYREWVFLRDHVITIRQRKLDRNSLWASLSTDAAGRIIISIERRRGQVVWRHASLAHRIELIEDKPCWSLFITGPKCRQWGFHCPKGWIPHYMFGSRGGCG